MNPGPVTSRSAGAMADKLLTARLPAGWRWSAPLARRVLGFSAATELLAGMPATTPKDFVRELLAALEIGWRIDAPAPLPVAGPLIVAANHPLGLVDGMVLLDWMLKTRGDVRLLANSQLAALPAVAPIVVPVTARAKRDSGEPPGTGALVAADAHLKRAGALLAFPAGAVARRLRSGVPVDENWHTGVARLATPNHCQVLPTAVLARNSPLFYALGGRSQAAADALLVREALACRGRVIPAIVGTSIGPPGGSEAEIHAFSAELRRAVEALQREGQSCGRRSGDSDPAQASGRRFPQGHLALAPIRWRRRRT